jgi:hypothetical protein
MLPTGDPHARHPAPPSSVRFPCPQAARPRHLQLNLGYRCNQSCLHCHVNAGPKRTEEMTAETIDAVIDFIAASPGVTTLDLTGGAPELNPQFRRLVVAARARGLRVIDRCNLTILEEPGFEDMAELPRRPSRRDRRLAALLPGGKRRPAARQGRVRGQPARPAAAQRAGLRQRRQRPAPEPGLQPAGPQPAAAAGRVAGRLQAATSAKPTAWPSTNCSPWPTCRSSALAAC